MSKLHQILYQNYLQAMHQFSQYPALTSAMDKADFGHKVHVLSIGKVAWKMASVSAKALSSRGIEHDGFVLTKYNHVHGAIPGFSILEAGHPIPDENSLECSKQVVNWLHDTPDSEDLIVLLSGGASSLFEVIPDTMSLSELQSFNNDLLRSGTPITQLNSLRIDVSLVKGGKALALCESRKIHVFALSDVTGNDPRVIGSGPFTPGITGRTIGSQHQYTLEDKQVTYTIVADNQAFCSLFSDHLRDAGFNVSRHDKYYKCSSVSFAEEVREILRKSRSPHYRKRLPQLIVMGGEVPVKVKGSGKGGRCSHLALSVANAVAKQQNTAFFCLATDGSDYQTGSGGAFVDSNTRNLLKSANFTITQTLAECDSFTALSSVNHILPAPLLPTNVNDIFILSLGYDFDEPFPANADDTCDIFEGHF